MPFTTTCGHSPVVISSSSPAAEPLTLDWTPPSHPPQRQPSPQLPDHTHQSARASGQSAGNTTAASLSSPGLPSPSQLLKSKVSKVRALPSGSRAQPAPTGAKLGFVSAASLARETSGVEREDDVSQANGAVKDRKKATKALENAEKDGTAKKPRKKATKDRMEETTRIADETSVKKARRKATAREKGTSDVPTSRTINFAGFAADTGVVADVEPVKKAPRKRAQKAKAVEGNLTATTEIDMTKSEKGPRQPRKRATKATKPTEESNDDSTKMMEPLAAMPTAVVPSQFDMTTTDPVSVETGERSNYFGPPSIDIPSPSKASIRRRSWTPVRDTELVEPERVEFVLQADIESVTSAEKARVPLGELLANFAYVGAGAESSVAMERTDSGESAKKRRRIESAENKALSAAEKKKLKAAEKAARTPKVPKPKAVKKKPQTITAVATAAYNTVPNVVLSENDIFITLEDDDGNGNGKLHFNAGVPSVPLFSAVSNTSDKQPPKAVKPRKPRAKATSDGKEPKAAKIPKGKGKAAFNAADHRPPLYSPERAYNQMMQQEFLFGTSSQLAAPESPTFIREMQFALLESEALQPSQTATRLPNAPHGTCLSVGQGDRNLWRSAARDFKGGLHRDSAGLVRNKTTVAAPKAIPAQEIEPLSKRILDVPDVPTPLPSEDAPCAQEEQSEFLDIDSIQPPPKSDDKPAEQIAVPEKTSASNAWTHIDEISDDEPVTTPSPPRRRANAPSLIIRELPLSPSKDTSNSEPASVLPLSTTADAQWSDKALVLFPKITSIIKGTPPSTDSASPTWHEKILLYDPIVLEDLTSWLNEQGLRVEVLRQKRKSAAKGRKKKADASGDQPDQVVESETETIEEPLQSWMVQKWCEENSVCCLWKDGLRGGVKTKY